MRVELSPEKLYISNTPQTTNAEHNTVLTAGAGCYCHTNSRAHFNIHTVRCQE